jgi:hypothetical protein
MALGSTQPLTDMTLRKIPGGKGRPAPKTDNFTAFCQPTISKMLEPRRLTTLWIFKACYRIALLFYLTWFNIKILGILITDRSYGFLMILTIKSDNFPKYYNRFVSVNETWSDMLVVRSEFLNNISLYCWRTSWWRPVLVEICEAPFTCFYIKLVRTDGITVQSSKQCGGQRWFLLFIGLTQGGHVCYLVWVRNLGSHAMWQTQTECVSKQNVGQHIWK